MDFKKNIEEKRLLIKDNLSLFMSEQRNEALPAIFKEQKLIESLEDFALRGKLIRGTLFILICESLGVTVDKSILNIACAIELMHSALLIQDDIIDRDRKRRGAMTVFARYEKEGNAIGAYESYHYGVSTAIVVADVAFFFAIELLSEYKNTNLPELLKYYSHEVYYVAVAESVDSIFGQTKREPGKDDIYAVYKYKTARYTFSLPFEMAAIVANADTKTRETLNRLGEQAGIIFQLKDDEIGLFGEEEIIGKPVGSDIRENKKTIIRSMLFQYADKEDQEILHECFGNSKAGESEIQKVKALYEKYQIKSRIENEVLTIMTGVWKDFESLQIREDSKSILKGLLEFNLSRSK